MVRGILIGQSATATEVSVLAALASPRRPGSDRFEIVLDGQRATSALPDWEVIAPFGMSARRRWDRWRGKHPIPVCAAKTGFDDLRPDTDHRIALIDRFDGSVVAQATVRTLPRRDHGRLNLVFGSCHALRHDAAEQDRSAEFLTGAYEELVESFGPANANLWLGDQVYADDHIARNFFAADPHRVIGDCYANTWGLNAEGPESGLAEMMRRSSNRYLPDDHEFWNDYPRASVTLPFHTAKRLVHHGYRYLRGDDDMPHPNDQGPWGRTAGAAYLLFQSPDRTAHHRFDSAVDPDPIQSFGVAGVTVAMLDTRWRRTMSKSRNPRAGFTTPEAIDRLSELAATDRPLVLALARPLIGHVSHQGWLTESWEAGPEHYRRQYRQLWSILGRRARSRIPTVVLAGDVHRHSVKVTDDGSLVEFVCPPMSLLDSLRPVDESKPPLVKELIGLKGRLVRRLWPSDTAEVSHVDPLRVDEHGVHATTAGERLIEPDGIEWEGLTMLTIDNPVDGPLAIGCHYRLRDTSTGADKPLAVTVAWDGDRWQVS